MNQMKILLGIAGILAGILGVTEFLFFGGSGWSVPALIWALAYTAEQWRN